MNKRFDGSDFSPSAQSASQAAKGRLGTSPPDTYWEKLRRRLPEAPVDDLRQKFDAGWFEFRPKDLRGLEEDARRLLETVEGDGWLKKEIRRSCPACQGQLDEAQAAGQLCPHAACGVAFADLDGVVEDMVFIRESPQTRDVTWVLALHGMNTRGKWQEEFNWNVSTTYGRSVPVAIYKYGKIIAGVVLRFRRQQLQKKLIERVKRLSGEAERRGFGGKPDVIAHSFGTWLLGHALESDRELKVGRVILTGCILRPDFEWKKFVEETEQVEAVLNHFGTDDNWAGIAHYAIWDSGPSGRRGFDKPGVINVKAEGFSHSQFFEEGILSGVYLRVWKPFLTLPLERLSELPNRHDPLEKWRQAVWPLRGTLLPVSALALVGGGILWLAAVLGQLVAYLAPYPALLAGVGVVGLVLLGILISLGHLVEKLVKFSRRR